MAMHSDVQCAICSSAHVRLVRGRYVTKYMNLPIELDSVEMYRCDDCGEEFFLPEQARALSKAVKAAARGQLGLLSPERVVAIRRKLKLSQEELESLLGLGPKVVTRWENGRVLQARTADDLLRVLEKLPQAVTILQEVRESRPVRA